MVSLLAPLEKSLPLHFSLGKKRICLDTQLKEEITDLFWKLPVWPVTENTWVLIWKKSLLICFESLQGIPYSHNRQMSRQEYKHFANMVNIIRLYVKDSLEDK